MTDFYPFICFLVSGIHLSIGASVLLKSPRGRVNRAFFVASAVLALWIALDSASVLYWNELVVRAHLTRFAAAAGGLAAISVAWFCFTFSRRNEDFALPGTVWIISFLVVLAALWPGAVFREFTLEGPMVVPVDGPLRLPLYVAEALVIVWGLTKLASRYRKSPFQEEKLQLSLMMAGILIPTGVIVIGLPVLNAFGTDSPTVASMGPLSTLAFILLTAYGMTRYGLFAGLPPALESLFDNLPVGVCVAQNDGCVIESNQEFSRIAGLDGKLAGRTVEKIIAHIESLAGEAIPSLQHWRESQSGCAHITVPDPQRILSVSYTCLTGNESKSLGYVFLLSDVTEIGRVERALRESEKRYRTLIEHATDIIVTIDIETGTLSSANIFLEDATGYRREDILEKTHFSNLIHPDDRERVLQRLQDRIDGVKRHPNTRFRLVRADGSYLSVEINGAVLHNGDGDPDYYLAIIRDVTERERAEEALRESERKFRALVELTSDLIWETDAYGTYTYASPMVKKILGYEPEEFIGKTFLDLTPADEVERVFEYFTDRARAKESFSAFVYTNLSGDGSRVTVESSAVPILDDDGNLVGYRGVDRDVTERIRAEEALKQSEEKVRALLNASTDSAILTDSRGTILAINETAAQRLGRTVDDLVGADIFSLFEPEVAKNRKAWANHVVRTGEPVRFEDERNGIVFDNSVYPIFDKNGLVIQVAIHGRDITEYKRANESIKKSEDHFRQLIENALDAIAVVGTDGTILYESPSAERIIGYKAEEILGTNVFDMVHPQHRRRVAAVFKQIVDNPDITGYEEFPFLHKDGAWRIAEVSAKKLPDEDRVVINYRDVTERKRAEEALRESEKRYRLLAEQVTDVIWTVDIRSLHFTYISPSVKRLRGFSAEEAMTQKLEDVLTPESMEVAMTVLAEELSAENELDGDTHKARTLELEQTHKDGSTVWTEVTATFLRDADGWPVELLGVARDITDRRRRLEELRAMSLVDELTGLYNRRGFVAFAQQQLKVAHRTKRKVCVLFLDFDNLKKINDSHGHTAGDAALVETANILNMSFRESDVIGRIGGDEFAVMAMEVPPNCIEVLSRRLKENIILRNAKDNQDFQISISMGVSRYDPEFPCPLKELLAHADRLMYEEKQAKKELQDSDALR